MRMALHLVMPAGLGLLLVCGRGGAAAQGSPAREVADLAWMTGHWQGEYRGGVWEEQFLAPAGKTILGTSRLVTGDRTAHKEFMLIDEQDGGIVYTVTLPGRKTMPFRLVQSRATEATFENAENDFPRRITYRRDGDALVWKLEGERQGKPATEELRMKRVPPPR